MNEPGSFAKRALIAAAIAVVVAATALALWTAISIVLILFAGILLAVFLRTLSDLVISHTPLSYGWALGLVVVLLIATLSGAFWSLAPQISEQTDKLTESIPQSINNLKERLEQSGWGKQVVAQFPGEQEGSGARIMSRATSVLSTTFGAIANLVVFLFVGLYLAVEPQLYTSGLLHLFPVEKRDRTEEILERAGLALRWWLMGQMASMATIGVLTTIGLALLGIPLALTLGLLAALLTFVPYLGPVVAAVPALLLALLESPTTALYVLLLYMLVQTLESYIVTPLIQQRMVKLPPALTIFMQVLFGILFGALGVVLAAPLTAAGLVMVKMIYVQDTLGDPVEV